MIRLRHYHDGEPILEDSVPLPAIRLLLKTAVQMTIRRSREKKSFNAPMRDIDVRVIASPRVPVVKPEAIVLNDWTIVVRTWSEKKPTVEVWELD